MTQQTTRPTTPIANLDGCPECGMAYSFYFGAQWHKVGCPSVGVSTPEIPKTTTHDCDGNAVPYESDGALGHGWECGVCGKFLQAG